MRREDNNNLLSSLKSEFIMKYWKNLYNFINFFKKIFDKFGVYNFFKPIIEFSTATIYNLGSSIFTVPVLMTEYILKFTENTDHFLTNKAEKFHLKSVSKFLKPIYTLISGGIGSIYGGIIGIIDVCNFEYRIGSKLISQYKEILKFKNKTNLSNIEQNDETFVPSAFSEWKGFLGKDTGDISRIARTKLAKEFIKYLPEEQINLNQESRGR